MAEDNPVDTFLEEAKAVFHLGESPTQYRYENPDHVADLLRQGFKPTDLEYDTESLESLIERGRVRGIQPGTGILSDPDKIRPEVRGRMDEKYGVGQWEYVDIGNDQGASCFKPLIKPSGSNK